MKKKILFITHLNPFNETFGAEQRTNIALKGFLDIGCNVDIAYIGDSDIKPLECPENIKIVFWNQEKIHETKLNKYKRLFLLSMFPKNQHLFQKINSIIKNENYDYIFCRYLPFAAKVGLKSFANKVLLDIDDLPVQALQIDLNKHNFLKRLYFYLVRIAYERDTKWWINNTKKCFVPNKKQAETLGISFLPNISIIENDIIPSHKTRYNILFIGKLDWEPNLFGIDFYLDNCWKKIKSEVPEAKIYIAGKGLPEYKKNEWLSKFKDVNILGYVNDLKDFYSKGNIVICPIYSGAGTNIKIAEAMAMSKALIVSKESIKGYESILNNDINCLIVNDIESFITNNINLLIDYKKQLKLAWKAREDSKLMFSQESVSAILKSSLNQET